MTSCKCAKKVLSDSPGLRKDFAIGLVDSVLNLPNGQTKFFGGIQITEVYMVDKSTDHRKLSPWLDEMKPNFETDSLP